MAPKPKKEAPIVQQEDLQDVLLLVVSVPSTRLQLGLVTPQLPAPQPLQGAAAAPTFFVEVCHNAVTAPTAAAALALGADFVLQCNLEHMFKHKKGPDVIDRIINSSVTLKLCNSSTKAVMATATIDLLLLGLGSSSIADGAVPWQPVATEDMFKVMPGSTVAVSVGLKYPSTAVAAPAPAPAPSSAGGSSTAGAGATPAQPLLEPCQLMTPEEAAGCNVLELTALPATPLPASWAAAAHAAAGGLACSLQLHLPGTARKPVQGPKCTGGCSSGAALEWPRQQQFSRVHLSAALTASLKAHLELGQPLLLEVARYLSGPAADTASDPAFGAYHALLQFEAAAEQLQELGAITAAGAAAPVGCMGWALQQGKCAAAGLPPCATPASARPKPIEEAPAAPTEGQAPVCAWTVAGTRFSLSLRLAKPLWEPWEPPAQPIKRLQDLFPPRAAPPPAPAPTAAKRFKAQIQHVAQDLASQYVQQAASSSSSSGQASKQSSSVASPPADVQQQLVFELNRSGRYLAVKQQLKPLLCELVNERYSMAAGARPGPAEVQQLHHDLYSSLVHELHAALAAATARIAAQQQQAQPGGQAVQESQQPEQQQEQQWERQAAAEAQQLLRLAAESELNSDLERCHALHMRRIAVLTTAEAWCDYGAVCIRSGQHAKAQTALQEALALNQAHEGAATVLLCLNLSQALSQETPGAPQEPAAAEAAEVLAHSLTDRQGADVTPWALLALLYRSQGKAQEVAARSCHQEVLRQSKAARAAASAAAAVLPAAQVLPGDAGATTAVPRSSDAPEAAPDAAVGEAAATAATATVCDGMPAANGYLAAAELLLHLHLPGLAHKLLAVASGLKDPDGALSKRLKLAHVQGAVASGDVERALVLLREMAEELGTGSCDEEKGVLQLLLGDAQYKAGNLALAKQHYRRALHKCPQRFSTRTYLQLGACFMASRDPAIAADMYASCITADKQQPPQALAAVTATAAAAAAPAWVDLAVGGAVDRLIPGCCASVWMQLALAYVRLGDVRSAELALSEANLCDPEHPGVWGQLALLALQQGREGEASEALREAHRFGLNSPSLLVELADKYTERGRFESAADCLARAAGSQDSVKVRCKLAAVLLSQRDYEGCRRQLAAAAGLPADESERQMLEDIVRKLQVAWPLL